MTSITKISFPAVMVAAILISACSAIITGMTVFYSNKEAVKDAISEIKRETAETKRLTDLELEKLKGRDALQDEQIAQLREAVRAATTYVGSGMAPEQLRTK